MAAFRTVTSSFIKCSRKHILSNDYVHTFNSYGVLKNRFKSMYSLEALYPKSSLDITEQAEIPKPSEKFSGYIPIEDLTIKYGQHYGFSGDRVEVGFNVRSATWISEKTKETLKSLHRHNITKDGYMLVKSEKTKIHALNLADCMDMIRCYIREAEKDPIVKAPETKRFLKEQLDRATAARLRKKKSV